MFDESIIFSVIKNVKEKVKLFFNSQQQIIKWIRLSDQCNSFIILWIIRVILSTKIIIYVKRTWLSDELKFQGCTLSKLMKYDGL